MFDFHMHSRVSFDSKANPMDMALAAKTMGLREICFTDHIDIGGEQPDRSMCFLPEVYDEAYDTLEVPGLQIRRGFEFGLGEGLIPVLEEEARRRQYDFILGSVHFVGIYDVYFDAFWQGKTQRQAHLDFLEETLRQVQNNDCFDVLAHLTFLSKATANPTHEVIRYRDHRELVDEILKTLADKGKGLEVNTSGVDICGEYLPSMEYLRRFKELGGQIVTVGSDAHAPNRVGQYCHQAVALLGEIFGYVCTFENRKPVFHKV